LSPIPDDASGTLVDLGCGTGWALAELKKLNRFELMGVDFAPAMIESAKAQVPSASFHCRDLESTGLANDSADVVFSNAAIQWCDPASAFKEMFRICKPGGFLRLSTFGPGTLDEIQTAWTESGDPTPRVHPFEAGDLLQRLVAESGFRDVQLSTVQDVQQFDSCDDLLTSIKQLGATNASSTRSSGLMGTSRYRKFRSVLDERLLSNGCLELTYECVYLSAQKPSS